MKNVLRSGSTPAAIQSAALSRAFAASAAQFLSAPTRWPRCNRPVGRIPETTRGFMGSKRKSQRSKGKGQASTFVLQQPADDHGLDWLDDLPEDAGQQQSVDDQEAVRT